MCNFSSLSVSTQSPNGETEWSTRRQTIFTAVNRSFVSGNRAHISYGPYLPSSTFCVSKWWITTFIDITQHTQKTIHSLQKYTRNGNEQISTNYVNFTGWIFFSFCLCMHRNEHETSAEYVAAGTLGDCEGLYWFSTSDRYRASFRYFLSCFPDCMKLWMKAFQIETGSFGCPTPFLVAFDFNRPEPRFHAILKVPEIGPKNPDSDH